MTDGETNEGDTPGEEVVVNTPEYENNSNKPSYLEEADRINKERASNLDREEKLQDRKEKLIAEERVGGRAIAGKPETPKTEKETAHEARVKAVGRAAGAQWAA